MDFHGEFADSDPEWNCQARLEEAVESFVQRTFGGNAVKSQSTVRARVTPMLNAWRNRQ